MELGSNFELDTFSLQPQADNVFQYLMKYHTIYMDSGRSAAAVLSALLKPGIILLPSYLCESSFQAYREKFTLRFYHIKKDLSIDFEDLERKLDRGVTAVYLMHYFGKLQDRRLLEKLLARKRRYGFTIIEDTTHSIFTKSRTIGDYCVCSLRKWFPIPDGGVLYSSTEIQGNSEEDFPVPPPSARLDAMILKNWYIKEGIDCNALYRRIFDQEEEKLDQQTQIYRISEMSKVLLKCFSIGELMERRRENYRMLAEFLTKHLAGSSAECLAGSSAGCLIESPVKRPIEPILEGSGFVPFTCPVYVGYRDAFRGYLMEHQVYCAVHWPMAGTELEEDPSAVDMSRFMLSLPIDQRYDVAHMEYLMDLIKKYEETEGG